MQELENIADRYQIDMVFTHWSNDLNTDHAKTWEISRVAFRKIKNILQYQSNSYFDATNQFAPQLFSTFTKNEYLFKIELLKLHETEWDYRKTRWEREIFDKEKFWGYLADSDYTEAFVIYKMIQDFNKWQTW